MTWKTELDRALHEVVTRGIDDKRPDWARLHALVTDYVALSPSRPESHFLVGVVEEAIAAREPIVTPADPAAATEAAPAAAPAPALPETPEGEPALWRWLGRLDAAARGGNADRVVSLCGEPFPHTAAPTPSPNADRVVSLCGEPFLETAVLRAREGRVALRGAGRALLSKGMEDRVYDLYARLVSATNDESCRKDADWVLGDSLRRSDDLLSDGQVDAATERLQKALAFATACGLDARTLAKVERKQGRAHQLAGRWADAATCYRAALDRLEPADRYRSVLHGDLALARLEVRGTLDLLPKEGRTGAAEVEALLSEAETSGEGESYNAIYTLGILAYERGDFAAAAARFREADRLMRETRAKARIVHARARFFLGACLLKSGATGEDLKVAEQVVTRDAGPAALDPAVKEPIFDLLAAAVPTAAIPGRARPRPERPERAPRPPRPERHERREGYDDRGERPPRDDRRERMDRRDRPHGAERIERYGAPRGAAPRGPLPAPISTGAPAPTGAGGEGPVAPAAPEATVVVAHLDEARAALATDPHKTLAAVDRAFKGRPTFDDWYAAYHLRLEALLKLGETEEARRTYERFRAKLHERQRCDRLEALLSEADSPAARLFDAAGLASERVDLYQALPGKDEAFATACEELANLLTAAADPASLRRAAACLREAVARGAERLRAAADEAAERARAAGAPLDGATADEVRERLAARGAPTRVLMVGGDAAHRPQAERVRDLGRRIGFEGAWVPAGAKPPHKTLSDVEHLAKQGASAILVLHGTGAELRGGVGKIASDLSVPVKDLPWTGPAGIESEVLSALRETF